MLDTKSKFHGRFNNSCEQESVPGSLKTFIGRIWGRGDFETESSDMTEAQTTLTISQLILFNAPKGAVTAVRQVLQILVIIMLPWLS